MDGLKFEHVNLEIRIWGSHKSKNLGTTHGTVQYAFGDKEKSFISKQTVYQYFPIMFRGTFTVLV